MLTPEEFLKQFKQKVNESGLIVIPTKKNRDYLARSGLLPNECIDIIINLTERNYSSGPELDRDRNGDVWIFGCRHEGERIYIKLKLDTEAKCLSFHP